jgi:hypothetical protein
MAKQHITIVRSEAYLVGRLVNVIWGDDWDAEYIVDNLTNMSFGKLIHNMYDPNLKPRRILFNMLCAH